MLLSCATLKPDSGNMQRQLSGKWYWVAKAIAIGLALFHIYTAGFGLFPDMQQRAIHILLGFTLTFLLISPTKKGRPQSSVSIWDIVLIVFTIAATVNSYLRYEWFFFHFGETTTPDLFLGGVIILLSLEAARRVSGWAFPLLTLGMFLYVFLGPYIPGNFGFRGFSPIFIIQNLYQTTLGVYGFVTGISATILAIFIVFGNILLFSGGGQTFIDIAIRLAGRFRGGPALVAVLASAMFGTISGSSVVNVASTGNFTIPLMKRLGYRPEFAGGVETVASTGGQLMPPIMGAGAFIMAEFLNVSYLQVAIAALIPAFLYFLAVLAGVRFRALRDNLPPMSNEDIVPLRELVTWRRLGPLVLPVAALLGFLGAGYSPITAGFWAIVAAIGLFLFSDFSMARLKERILIVVGGLERAGQAIITIVSLAVCANIVVNLISVTGVGVKVSDLIITSSGGIVFLAAILGAVVSLILGMGMPTTPAYIIAASVVSPAFNALGILPMAGQLFIFYFACISVMTPPVCVAAFVAAAISKASWQKVARVALSLGVISYIIPFIFIFQPALLMVGNPLNIIFATVSAALGAVLVGAVMMGYLTFRLSIVTRLLMLPGAILLLIPHWQFTLLGFALSVSVLIADRFLVKRSPMA